MARFAPSSLTCRSTSAGSTYNSAKLLGMSQGLQQMCIASLHKHVHFFTLSDVSICR